MFIYISQNWLVLIFAIALFIFVVYSLTFLASKFFFWVHVRRWRRKMRAAGFVPDNRYSPPRWIPKDHM